MSVFSMDDLLLRSVVRRNPAEWFRIGATSAASGRSGPGRPERGEESLLRADETGKRRKETGGFFSTLRYRARFSLGLR